MNVEFQGKDSDEITFDTINGAAGVPVVKALGKIGFKDPYNHTYYKRSMSGERYGFGVALFGSVGGSSFVKPIVGEVQVLWQMVFIIKIFPFGFPGTILTPKNILSPLVSCFRFRLIECHERLTIRWNRILARRTNAVVLNKFVPFFKQDLEFVIQLGVNLLLPTSCLFFPLGLLTDHSNSSG